MIRWKASFPAILKGTSGLSCPGSALEYTLYGEGTPGWLIRSGRLVGEYFVAAGVFSAHDSGVFFFFLVQGGVDVGEARYFSGERV